MPLTKEQYRQRALKAAETRRKNAAKKKTTAPPSMPKKSAAPKPVVGEAGTCLCGCGAELARNRRFTQGHDAKLHSMVLQAVKEGNKLPAKTRRLAADYIKNRWSQHAKSVL